MRMPITVLRVAVVAIAIVTVSAVSIVPIAIVPIAIVPVAVEAIAVVSVAIARDPVIDLRGKILQALGLDADHKIPFLWGQGETVIKVP